MMKLFKRILDFFNIHPDKNQRWTLSTVFVVGLLYTYVQPAITKAWVSELPAEWIAFQSLAYSICGLLIGMIWKGWVRRKAIQWFTILCIIESAAGFFVGMWLSFVEYNVWVLAIACLLYGTLISEFVGKCLMTFRPKLWNEHEREVYDNNNDVVWHLLYCWLCLFVAVHAIASGRHVRMGSYVCS
jgi:hypothetical protein